MTDIPVTIYERRDASSNIIGAGPTPWVIQPGEEQTTIVYNITPTEVAAAPTSKAKLKLATRLARGKYEARFALAVDEIGWQPGDVAMIAADGVDTVTILVSTSTAANPIVLRFTARDDAGAVLGVTTQAVPISAGAGSLPVTADNAALITVSSDDRDLFDRGGRGSIVIKAVTP